MNYDDMSFEEKFNFFVEKYPGIRASTLREWLYGGFEVVDGLAPHPDPVHDSLDAWALWVLDSPKIMELITSKDLFKIHMIKEVRATTGLGLKEAKEIVERALDMHEKGVVGALEAERLDRDVQQVVKSLTGGD